MQQKIIAFDLDDVLCVRDKKYEHLGIEKYKFCTPMHNNIVILKNLYDMGFYIKIYTARGMSQLSGNLQEINLKIKPITEEFLANNKIPYHELVFGKIHYDILIDDKALNSMDISIQKILNIVK
jgi:hydroxymethylpyrimidine pyrophosphatase-like HAD family hydrolase